MKKFFVPLLLSLTALPWTVNAETIKEKAVDYCRETKFTRQMTEEEIKHNQAIFGDIRSDDSTTSVWYFGNEEKQNRYRWNDCFEDVIREMSEKVGITDETPNEEDMRYAEHFCSVKREVGDNRFIYGIPYADPSNPNPGLVNNNIYSDKQSCLQAESLEHHLSSVEYPYDDYEFSTIEQRAELKCQRLEARYKGVTQGHYYGYINYKTKDECLAGVTKRLQKKEEEYQKFKKEQNAAIQRELKKTGYFGDEAEDVKPKDPRFPPKPAKTGNRFLDHANDICYDKYIASQDNESILKRWRWVDFLNCVKNDVEAQVDVATDAQAKSMSDFQIAGAALVGALGMETTRAVVGGIAKGIQEASNEVNKVLKEYTDALKQTHGIEVKAFQNATPSSSVNWGPSRKTCCGSPTMKFKEAAESLQSSMEEVIKEAQNVIVNRMNNDKLDTSLQEAQNKFEENMLGASLQSLSEITKRKLAAYQAFNADRAYGFTEKTNDSGSSYCSPDESNLLSNMPFANKWMGGTFNVRTVKVTKNAFINPLIFDGSAKPKDELEQWILKNPQFYPKKLWTIFTPIQTTSSDAKSFNITSFGSSEDEPIDADIETSEELKAPVVKTKRPPASKLSSFNLTYDPTEKAVTYYVNMLLKNQTLPANLNPGELAQGKRSGFRYILSDLPSYSAFAGGTNSMMDYMQWRQWALKAKGGSGPFQKNFIAEMGVREAQAAAVKSVITDYMVDRLKPFPAPNGLTANEALIKGFVDAYLPPSEQQNASAKFADIKVEGDDTFKKWLTDMGLPVNNSYTAAQKREVTVTMLTHPYIHEMVIKVHGDELKRILIKYQNTLVHLRKKRLDELKKQRLLLTVINDNERNNDNLKKAAMSIRQ